MTEEEAKFLDECLEAFMEEEILFYEDFIKKSKRAERRKKTAAHHSRKEGIRKAVATNCDCPRNFTKVDLDNANAKRERELMFLPSTSQHDEKLYFRQAMQDATAEETTEDTEGEPVPDWFDEYDQYHAHKIWEFYSLVEQWLLLND